MSKKEVIKDLITGICITLLFGGAYIAGIVMKEYLFIVILCGLMAIMGLALIGLAIWGLGLVKKDYAYTQTMKELQERKRKAEEELRKAQEEAKELSNLNQHRG